jgi:uncharacterized protein (TIGR03437 family)
VQVLFDGVPAPLFMVSPQQINFYVPMGAHTSGYSDLQVVSKSTGQVYGAGTVPMNIVSPALFLNPPIQSGMARYAAVINHDDGTINGPGNPAKAGSWIEIYGTGQGFVAGAPADGDVATGPLSTSFRPQVIVNGVDVDDSSSTGTAEPGVDHIYYSGLAPEVVGMWQINVKIPANVAPGTFSAAGGVKLTGNQVDLQIVVHNLGVYDPSQYHTVVAVKR